MFFLFLQHFLSSNKNLIHQLGSISSTTLATSSVVFCDFCWTFKRNTAPPKVGGTSIIFFETVRPVKQDWQTKPNFDINLYMCSATFMQQNFHSYPQGPSFVCQKYEKKAFPPHGPRILGHPNLLGSVDCGGAGSPFQGNSGIST